LLQADPLFRSAANPVAVARWEAWLGRPAHTVLDFLARESFPLGRRRGTLGLR
jgi:hypothetical protein